MKVSVCLVTAMFALGAVTGCTSDSGGPPTAAVPTAAASPSAAAGETARAMPATATVLFAEDMTFDNVLAYCAAVGTVDMPAGDARWVGGEKPSQITEILKAQPSGSYARPTNYYSYQAWRCMSGAVYYCVGGFESCDYAIMSQAPTPGMAAFCTDMPDAVYIPDYVVGVPLRSVYWWECRQGVPQIREQLREVDAQGFLAGAWLRLP